MKTALIAIGGAIVGASAACLLWAEPCASTRKAIREKTAEATGKLQEISHTVTEQVKEKAKDVVHRSGDLMGEGKELLDRAEGYLARARDMAEGVTETVSHGQDAAEKAKSAMAMAGE